MTQTPEEAARRYTNSNLPLHPEARMDGVDISDAFLAGARWATERAAGLADQEEKAMRRAGGYPEAVIAGVVAAAIRATEEPKETK
jgi:hypothetical protein